MSDEGKGRQGVETRLMACVVGWPIEHSRSPIIHNYWMRKYCVAGGYEKKGVRPGDFTEFARHLEEHGYVGCSVTLPHKEAAFAVADRRDDAATSIGAANLLWKESGLLWASNTDAYGFIANLDHVAPNWRSSMDKAVVLGAGGAARAVVYGLLDAGVKRVVITNRTRQRADEFVDVFAEQSRRETGSGFGQVSAVDWSMRENAIEDAGLIVNTTSLGMTGQPALELSLAGASLNATVADIVYAPLETELLAAARTRGLPGVDGLGMLLHQAVPHFETWFGVRPEVTDELRALLVANIVGG